MVFTRIFVGVHGQFDLVVATNNPIVIVFNVYSAAYSKEKSLLSVASASGGHAPHEDGATPQSGQTCEGRKSGLQDDSTRTDTVLEGINSCLAKPCMHVWAEGH